MTKPRATPKPRAKRKPAGRPPTTMTAAACTAIVGFVADGLRFERAAVAAGVDAAVARRHKSRNAAFDRKVAKAEADYEICILQVIRDAAPKNWTAAAWIAERRWPGLYGPPALQMSQTNVSVDADTVVKGIEAFLKIAEARHNPPGAVDVDAPAQSEAK